MMTNLEYLNWVLSIVIIILLLAFVFLGLRFLSRLPYSMRKPSGWFKIITNQNNNISILGVKYIDLKHKIVLLNYEDKVYVVMLGAQRDILLDVIISGKKATEATDNVGTTTVNKDLVIEGFKSD